MGATGNFLGKAQVQLYRWLSRLVESNQNFTPSHFSSEILVSSPASLERTKVSLATQMKRRYGITTMNQLI